MPSSHIEAGNLSLTPGGPSGIHSAGCDGGRTAGEGSTLGKVPKQASGELDGYGIVEA